MKISTRQALDELTAKADKEYGKIVQKLLAIALLEAGATDLTERSVQGIDLEFLFGGKRHACEVKTTEGDTVRFGKKDIAGLEAKLEHGDEVYLAILGGSVLDNWLFARFHRDELLASKDYPILQLRAYRNRTLEHHVRRPFEEVLETHFEAATTINAQQALNEVLARYDGWRLA